MKSSNSIGASMYFHCKVNIILTKSSSKKIDTSYTYLFSFLPPKMVKTHILALYHALPHPRP